MQNMTRLPTEYQQFIHLSRYSRWLENEGRRETWDETVERYFVFFEKHLKDNQTYTLKSELRAELKAAIINLEVMPSMRSLMTAGEALSRSNIAGYNPVSGDTMILTKEHGSVKISELVGLSATVLNKNGMWVDASFNSYGVQKLTKVVFHQRKCRSEKVVECTENHRWLLVDGTVKPTSELVVGDRIPFVSAPKPAIDDDYRLGVIHGLVYGDGTATKSCKRVKGYHIRLCGDSRELINFFEGYPITYPPTYGGDPVVMLYDGFAQTHQLKTLPNKTETESYLLGFVRGWMAADGSVTKKNGQVSLCLCADGLKWINENAERVGLVVQSHHKMNAETNYGMRRKEAHRVFFCRESCVAEDFLCSWKRANFFKSSNPSYYEVDFLTETNITSEVFCAEVEDTNTFVLCGGLVTGNCAYVAVNHIRAFSESLFVLMNGTGVGFSVERQFVEKLPTIAEEFSDTDTTIVVEDSKQGWAKAYKELISLLIVGQIPRYDLSKVRPAGARLKTFGGRASGPDPLEDLFKFTINTAKRAAGRKFSSIECHDIMCMIGSVVVVGGVRRAALISLSNLTDEKMRDAKTGAWWHENSQRALANNSVAYKEKPDIGVFMEEWISLYKSKSGERGIFNRQSAKKTIEKLGDRRDAVHDFGVNPCGEILLRDREFCNLTEVIVRPNDTQESLARKIRLATILGTFQASLTNFPFLSSEWKKNCEEEALLGVSLTGIMDCEMMYSGDGALVALLEGLKQVAIDTNKEWAKKIHINPSAAITTCKPSGTISQLCNTASGIHTRHSEYYVRTVRADNKDPLCKMMKDMGFPCEPCVMKPEYTTVFSFPQSAVGSVTRKDMTAIEHLRLWLTYKRHWTEHNPSITVTIKEDEWMEVGAWVYENFDEVCGVSFLPEDSGSYRQAPYQECNKEQYETLLSKMPQDVDWDLLKNYEKEDTTTGSQELACSAGGCDVR